jgi:hypothetical protein
MAVRAAAVHLLVVQDLEILRLLHRPRVIAAVVAILG